jgi:hypothetical protein
MSGPSIRIAALVHAVDHCVTRDGRLPHEMPEEHRHPQIINAMNSTAETFQNNQVQPSILSMDVPIFAFSHGLGGYPLDRAWGDRITAGLQLDRRLATCRVVPDFNRDLTRCWINETRTCGVPPINVRAFARRPDSRIAGAARIRMI